jgi:hypothetical protein
MTEQDLRRLAERVADALAQQGVFVEDDTIDGLAATLRAFVVTAGLAGPPMSSPFRRRIPRLPGGRA